MTSRVHLTLKSIRIFARHEHALFAVVQRNVPAALVIYFNLIKHYFALVLFFNVDLPDASSELGLYSRLDLPHLELNKDLFDFLAN